jgi:hypothetical protein
LNGVKHAIEGSETTLLFSNCSLTTNLLGTAATIMDGGNGANVIAIG